MQTGWMRNFARGFAGLVVLAVAFLGARTSLNWTTAAPLGQDGSWEFVYTGTSATLYDASWYTAGLGYIVGANGTVIHVDKQNPAAPYLLRLTLGITATLYGVDTPTYQRGCLVGAGGTAYCLKGKMDWIPASTGTTRTLYDVDLVWRLNGGDELPEGWAVGEQGVIRRIRYVKSGSNVVTTWTAQDQTGYMFFAVHAASLSEAWVGGVRLSDGKPVILHTADAGASWQVQYVGTNPGAVRDIHAQGSDVWAVGDDNLVVRSLDGGNTWSPVNVGAIANWTSVWRAPGPSAGTPDAVWIAGEGGLIRYSDDGGTTFRAQSSGTTQHIWGLAFFNAFHGSAAVGDNGLFLWYNAPTRTMTALYAPTPPVIDGNLDEWAGATGISLNGHTAEFVNHGEPVPQNFLDRTDSSVRAYAAWNEDYVYFAFDVQDDQVVEDSGNPWLDDEVEIAIDGIPLLDCCFDWPDGPDHQYTLNPSGRMTDWGSPSVGITGVVRSVVTTTTGWRAEVAIPRDELNNGLLTPGKTLGITFGYHDDDDGGGYDAYYVWEGYLARPSDPFPSVPPPLADYLAAFGKFVLSDTLAPWVTPTPTPSPTPTLTPTPTPTPSGGTITGVVFEDLNRNRAYDTGEPGLAGARVQALYGASTLVGDQVTGSDGRFTFANVQAGMYLVRVITLPSGYEFTTPSTEYRILAPGATITVTFGAASVPTPTPTPTPTSTPTPVPVPPLHIPYIVSGSP